VERALVQQTLGCPEPASAAALHELAQRMDLEAAGGDRNAVAVLDGFLLLRPAIQGEVLDARILGRLRTTTGFPQAVAGADLLRGDTASARAILQRAESSWLRPPTPDIGLATARMWLAMRDTAAARNALDITLGAMDSYDVALFFYDAGTTSAYLSAAILRSALGGTLPHWSQASRRVVAAMWQGSDASSSAIAARLASSPVP
jgi:hypothetical protein